MESNQVWRLISTPPANGARNMAIDQALAESYAATWRPTLRLYRWQPSCLSLGLGQRLLRDVNIAACAERGIEIVRRPTGGRAILHDCEVTYALVIGLDHPIIAGSSIVESYRRISAALCHGLRQLGIAPELAPRPAPHARKSAACFDLPGDYEITIAGRKLVGSAQARHHGVLLQHGTILLHADVELLTTILRLPPDLMASALAQRLIALDEVLAPPPSFETVAAAIVHGFEAAWQIKLEPGELSQAESERTRRLIAEKYGNPAWTARR